MDWKGHSLSREWPFVFADETLQDLWGLPCSPATKPVDGIAGEHDKEGIMLGGLLDRLADLGGARPFAGAVIGRDGKIIHSANG